MDIASDEPRICPFLRSALDDGSAGPPIRSPDGANRCIAMGDLAPQSLQQQAYACLTPAHVTCRRYLYGVHVLDAPETLEPRARMRLTPAIVAALVVLAASFALSVGFVVANGGLNLPPADDDAQAAVGSPPAGARELPSDGAADSPAPSQEPSDAAIEPTPTATPIAAPTPTPTATATPIPRPTTSEIPSPSSERYLLLEPCPDEPDCWIYTVRAGDNLFSIARYFGVPMDVVTEGNPWTETTPLVAGQELRLPPPTR